MLETVQDRTFKTIPTCGYWMHTDCNGGAKKREGKLTRRKLLKDPQKHQHLRMRLRAGIRRVARSTAQKGKDASKEAAMSKPAAGSKSKTQKQWTRFQDRKCAKTKHQEKSRAGREHRTCTKSDANHLWNCDKIHEAIKRPCTADRTFPQKRGRKEDDWSWPSKYRMR